MSDQAKDFALFMIREAREMRKRGNIWTFVRSFERFGLSFRMFCYVKGLGRVPFDKKIVWRAEAMFKNHRIEEANDESPYCPDGFDEFSAERFAEFMERFSNFGGFLKEMDRLKFEFNAGWRRALWSDETDNVFLFVNMRTVSLIEDSSFEIWNHISKTEWKMDKGFKEGDMEERIRRLFDKPEAVEAVRRRDMFSALPESVRMDLVEAP
ncbi:MAG: hypothetical protein J6Y62_01775 [Clostridia bacterium]|nr:hypothetical protein [Clostridia bacterium]